MDIYAMTDYDGCDYITAGKLYKVDPVGDRSFNINDDEGDELYCLWNNCALINDESWQRVEVGTLKELDVKPGDVVGLVWNGILKEYSDEFKTIDDNGNYPARGDYEGHKFRTISRSSDAPKTWGEMTNAEKGALLLAAHEGKVIEWSGMGRKWKEDKPRWISNLYYRVRPEPKRETKRHKVWAHGEGRDTEFEVVDGKVDWSTFKIKTPLE